MKKHTSGKYGSGDLTFRQGKVVKNKEDGNFYFMVDRQNDKLSSKVFEEFNTYMTTYLKEIDPFQNGAVRRTSGIPL